MTNRNARLAQQCAPLLFIVLLLSASPGLEHPLSVEDHQTAHGRTNERTLRNASQCTGHLVEVCTTELGVLTNDSCTVSNEASSQEDYLNEAGADGLYCWPADKLPVKVFILPSSDVPFYRDSFPATLKSCFDEWTAASGGKLGWVEVSDLHSADIVVRWSSQAQERPEGTEGGRTKTYAQLDTATNRGIIHRVEMTLLTRLPERELTDIEVQKAYLHEVGHAFGIVGHSSHRGDIMYFAVCNSSGTHLMARDRASINRLYSGYEPLKAVVGSGSTVSRREHS
jgi:hypothetical protein